MKLYDKQSLMLVFGLLLLLFGSQARATNVSGVIFSNTTWTLANSPYYLTGDVQIASGATLTIEPGVQVIYSGVNEILVQGAIVANGTASQRISFTSSTPGVSSGATMLRFAGADLSLSQLSYVSMNWAGAAINVSGTGLLAISNLFLDNASITGAASVTISNSTISNSDVSRATGICGTLTVQDSIVTASRLREDYQTCGSLVVQRNTIRDSSISSDPNGQSNTLNVLDSSIKKSNVYCGVSATCNVLRNSLENSTIRGYAYSPLTITDTVITYSGSSGIQCSDSMYPKTCNISNTTVIGDGTGVGIDMSSGTITNTTISDNLVGVRIMNGGGSTMQNNNFIRNGMYNVENTTAGNVSASGSYWNTVNVSTIQNSIFDYYSDINKGVVSYSPPASAPLVSAPISSPYNIVGTVNGANLDLTWNANPESDVAGYKVYWDVDGGFPYAHVIDVGNVTAYSIVGIPSVAHITVTAYDTYSQSMTDNPNTIINEIQVTGHESAYGVEIFHDVAKPVTTLSQGGGVFTTPQAVTLICDDYTGTGCANTYYTLDGSVPTTASPLYTGALTLSSNTTIKFFSVDNAGNANAVQSAVYTIDLASPTTTPSIAAGTYNGQQTITLGCSDSNTGCANTYYTVDGSTPTTASARYTAPIIITDNATVRYFSVDNAGNTEPLRASFYDINLPPSSTTATITTKEDVTSSAVTPTTVDPDVGNYFTYTISTQASNGTASVVGNRLVYTPSLNFFGGDSFTFTATDQGGLSVSGTATVTVSSVNDAPVAVTDSVTTQEDVAVTTPNVLLNDTDVENDAITLISVATTSLHGGSVVDNRNGTFSYTPPANFNGSDSFTYTIKDAPGATAIGTVTITVTAVNDVPTATSMTIWSAEDNESGATVPLVTDVDLQHEGDSHTFSIVTSPSNGTVKIVNNQFLYTSNLNFNGSDSFTYRVTDSAGAFIDAVASVIVGPVNDAPSLVQGSINTTLNSTGVTYTPFVYDVDTDYEGDSFTFQVVVQPTFGVATVTAAKDAIVYVPNTGWTGADSMTVLAIDKGGLTVTGTINLTVKAPASPTVVNQTLSVSTVTFGETVTVNGTLLDSQNAPSTVNPAFVNVTFTTPAGGTVARTAITNSFGQFSVPFRPDAAGSWSVQTAFPETTVGTVYAASSSSAQTFTVGAASSALSINSNMQSAILGNTIQLSGKLTPSPDTGIALQNIPLSLMVTDPNGVQKTVNLSTNTNFGNYSVNYMIPTTGVEGSWSMQVSFAGDNRFTASSSAPVAVNVVKSAGYAILVEGRIAGNAGIDAHHKTLRKVYKRMIERNILPGNIQYLSFNEDSQGNPLPVDPNIPIDGIPTQAAVQKAISNWAAQKMTSSPGPLFITFVNHGSPGVFHIYQGPQALQADNEITPLEVGAMLNALDANLAAAGVNRAASPVVFVDGSCYSGTFIADTSAANRVIISSADADEVSYKGAKDPSDNIREGEYFVSEFYKAMAEGTSLADAFDIATRGTEELTKDESAANGHGRKHLDQARQHPQLDDNGDGVSSDAPLNAVADGALSSTIFLGYGTNAIGDVQVLRVPATLHLDAGVADPLLSIEVSDPTRVDTVWVEIKQPGYTPPAGTAATIEQVDPQMTMIIYDQLGAGGTSFQWTPASYNRFTSFAAPGKYELFFYAKDAVTGNISSFKKMLVYRNAAGNQPPAAFNLLMPSDGYTQGEPVLLDWQDSLDPDGNPVSYQLEVSTSSAFVTPVAVVSGVQGSQFLIEPNKIVFDNGSIGLTDGATYYWRVSAVDSLGAATLSSSVFSFTVNNTNSASGTVSVKVQDALTGKALTGGTISVVAANGGIYSPALTAGNLSLFMGVPNGTIDLHVVKSGYLDGWLRGKAFNAGDALVFTVGLTSANSAPVVTPPAAITAAATDANGIANTAPLVAKFLSAATATDGVDAVANITNNAPATLPVGTTTVTFSATDAAGLTGTATSTVTVTAFSGGTTGGRGSTVPSPTANDRDGDGVADALDAFPDDPAASVDADGDGFPDAWNASAAIATVNASSLVIDQFPNDKFYHIDSDGDLIADGWETQYFGNLSTANMATDFDGDGISDLQEFVAGSDPLFASDISVTIADSYGNAGSQVAVPVTISTARGVSVDSFAIDVSYDSYALTPGSIVGNPSGWSILSAAAPKTPNGLSGQVHITGTRGAGAAALQGSQVLWLPMTLPVGVVNSTEYLLQVDANSIATSSSGAALGVHGKGGRLRVAVQAPMRFSLQGGWNYLSFDLDPGKNGVAAWLSAVPETLSIWHLNTQGRWESYQSVLPNDLNTLKTLESGQAYWVQVSTRMATRTVQIAGISPAATVRASLHSGWNSVALNAQELAMTPAAYLTSVGASQIWSYSNGTWSSYISGSASFLNSLQTLQAGVGYYVFK